MASSGLHQQWLDARKEYFDRIKVNPAMDDEMRVLRHKAFDAAEAVFNATGRWPRANDPEPIRREKVSTTELMTSHEAAKEILGMVRSPLMPPIDNVSLAFSRLIDMDGNVAPGLSSGERALVKIALFAWNGARDATLADLFSHIDRQHRRDVLRILGELF